MNDFISGCVGGVLGTFAVYPLDTLRIRLQTKTRVKRHIYSGVVSPMMGIGLEKAVVFGSFHYLAPYIKHDFACGLLSGFLASLVVTPVEYLKIQKQRSPELTYSSMLRSVAKDGIRPLYSGLSACFMREVPGYAIYFQTYNSLRNNNVFERYCGVTNSALQTLLCGGLSGANSWIFIYPFDVIKTHMQIQERNPVMINKSVSPTFIVTARALMKSGQLYKGFSLGVTRAFCLHSCVFLGYEVCSSYLVGEHREERV